ncbi:peptidoglycan-associated lipoprotein [candidate division KSB3 bacterium]|uniref:Peptidoglycan-associated lipoprotein n=1 Tax=candidate division KSB3 bacterium TaxID=2044937 RepID=A0A2G6KFC2_9BACT|nr:MAG: peptidoglycan-associated lipoprotein [candidate division KSB3 bacterium]
MERYRKTQNCFMFGLTVLLALAFTIGCASKKPTQSEMTLPPVVESEPAIIELGSSRVDDILRDGDIVEENRDDLPWLPKRPPSGMHFESTSALQTVYFEFDKYSLTGSTRSALEANAEWLRNNPDVLVRIEGHCDERGTLEYNQVLGENRALSAKKYLASLGIAPNRLYTISYGESMPADPGHSEDAWANNRRAEFKIGR